MEHTAWQHSSAFLGFCADDHHQHQLHTASHCFRVVPLHGFLECGDGYTRQTSERIGNNPKVKITMTSCQNTSPTRIHKFFMSLSRIVIGMNSFRCSEVLSEKRSVLGSHRRTFRRSIHQNRVCRRYENEPHLSAHRKWVMGSLSSLDYTEVVEANYDKSVTSLSEILELFFENHDYSVVYPKRYASVIYYTEDMQREECEYYMKHYLVMSYARHEPRRRAISQPN